MAAKLKPAGIADTFAFDALVGPPRAQVLELLDLPAGPMQYSPFDRVAPAHTESNRHFGLRQVTGSALHHTRLGFAAARNPHHSADSIAIGFRPYEPETNGSMSIQLIVAVKMDGPLVGGDEDIQVSIAIEIAKCCAAPDLGIREAAAQGSGHVLESTAALIEKQMGRLRIAGFGAGFAAGC